jgi:branched-chain amino acid transport system permease protein
MELVLQIAIHGIAVGGIYALLAVGFGLIYGTTRDFHVAHGAIFTLAGYVGYLFSQVLGLNVWLSLLIAIALSALAGFLIDKFIYAYLRRKKVKALAIFIASLGLMIMSENVIALVFGQATAYFKADYLQKPVHLTTGIAITPIQLIIIVMSLIGIVVVYYFLNSTLMGRMIRAVADSEDMARTIGININKVYTMVYVVGSVLAAPAGVLLAIDAGATPYRGTTLVLLAMIAVIFGGIGSILGAAVAALILALLENMSILVISSAWTEALVFAVFLVLILVKPTGLFGQRAKS